MAKAKKTESAKTEASKPETAAAGAGGVPKKAAAPAAKKAVAAAGAKSSSDLPAINTGSAASFAAKFIAGREKLANAVGEMKESREFRQMKENMKKPAGAGDAGDVLHNLLNANQKQSNLPSTQNRQAGHAAHSQTAGNTRTNVPRRTNG